MDDDAPSRGRAPAEPPWVGDSTETVGPHELIAHGPPGVAEGHLFAGRFLLGRCLGRGGFGIVYLAHDRLVRRDVALKILRAERNDERSLRRFRREATVARDVASPNVVRIFEVGAHQDLQFLVVEYLAGGTLRDRLVDGPLDLDQAVELAIGIARGLAALHAVGLVHRDLKPSNVLFDGEGTPKVADFGLVAWHEGDATRSVAFDAWVGTALYIAPEQALGREVDPRSDLFSLGVVLYEMLAAEPPFAAASSVGTILQRLGTDAPPIRRVRPEVPRWLARVVGRLLERQPGARYPSAEALLADLESRRSTWTPKRRKVAALAVVLALAGGVAVREYQGSRFASLRESTSVQGVEAIDRRGRVLWRRTGNERFPANRAPLARLPISKAPRLVTVIRPTAAPLRPEHRNFLTVIDPQSGAIVRQVGINREGGFPGHSDRFTLLEVTAVDLEGDAIDEVIVSFGHTPSWPSYSVLWEPRPDRVRQVLQAAGWHTLLATEDLDGDGRRDLVFSGFNSALGRYPSVVAVRLPTRQEEKAVTSGLPAHTPGLGRLLQTPAGTNNPWAPLWSRLLPRGGIIMGAKLDVDRSAGMLRLHYTNGKAVEVTFTGGSRGDPLTPGESAELRHSAFRDIEDARRLAAVADWTAALAAAERAVGAAGRVDDPPLQECAARERGAILVAAGLLDLAEEQLNQLASKPEAASEIAFSAGVAYHLAGHLERAVAWYRRGLGAGGEYLDGSRARYFYLEGVLLALGELGRWQEAVEAARQFGQAFADRTREAAVYADFARARLGLAVGTDTLAVGHSSELLAYLMLERRRDQGEEPSSLLAEVPGALDAAYETRGAIRSLEAQLLADLGRHAEARDVARTAVGELAAVSATSTDARGLLPLARERLREMERAAAGPSQLAPAPSAD